MQQQQQQQPAPSRTFEGIKERARRPVRNKRYNRKIFGDRRPPKRLFTPEIKRFLKDWLVRRRENPYPNRDEKKTMAVQTGLTYIQVCNWFANWRRKLKNAGKEPQHKTWGHLIKSYNSQEMEALTDDCDDDDDDDGYYEAPSSSHRHQHSTSTTTHTMTSIGEATTPQCLQVSSSTTDDIRGGELLNPFAQQHNKYKNHIMEKYLRDCQNPANYDEYDEITKPSMITRWLESAANFKPCEKNYLYYCDDEHNTAKLKKLAAPHGREELDAAEALTTLANAHALHK